ncbi:immunoglobulin-like domain-containing protein, partial [Listeria riparia]
SKPGNYEVTYEVIDTDGNQATFTRTIKVTEAPIITGETMTKLNPNSVFDPMSTMQATDKEDGDITAKIQVVSNSVDTSKPGNYEVTYEVIDTDGNQATFTRTIKVTEAPIITGETMTKLNPNSVFDPMGTMQATDKEDGDITAKIQVVSNSVDTSKSGNYEVTYEVTDTDGNQTTFTRTVKVTEAPVITGEATTKLNPNSVFDPMSTMQATDKEDGDITAKIQVVSNSVDTSKSGNYEVTYEVTDTDGNKATFTRTVKVTEAPVIAGETMTKLNPKSVFDPMSTMQATDKEDGNITKQIKVVRNNVDISKPGTYKVMYEVTDKDGNKATFERIVKVKAMEKKDKLIVQPVLSALNLNTQQPTQLLSPSKISKKLPKTGDKTSQAIGWLGCACMALGSLLFRRKK